MSYHAFPSGAEGFSYREAGIWSLHPFDLIEFILPDQFGLATDIKKYWNFQNWLKTIYMGGIPFILAAFFLRKWDRRAQGFLLIFFISIGMAMGSNALFHHFLYENLPFFNKLRYPVKFIFMAVLVLSLAAGLGYDYFKNESEKTNPKFQRWLKYVLILGFLCMIAFGLINLLNEPLLAYLKAVGWDHPRYNKTEFNLFNLKRLLVISSLFCLCLYLYTKPQLKKPAILIFLITLFTLDLFFAHFNLFEKGNLKEIQKTAENAKFIQSVPELFRIYVNPRIKKENFLINPGKGLDLRKELFSMGLLGNQQIYHIGGIAVTKVIKMEKNDRPDKFCP